jgi:hypothetical protein
MQSLLEIPKTIYMYIVIVLRMNIVHHLPYILIMTLTMNDSQICINVNFYLNSVGGLDRQTDSLTCKSKELAVMKLTIS